MLEPTVRPGSPASTGGVKQGKPAFENRSFDELLTEAKTNATDNKEAGNKKPAQVDPLGALGGLGQVENAALREVLAKSDGTETGLKQTD
ncbi:MAG: hypothetical protein AAGB26_14970 [Planctomycetota bacterium]